jgi:2-polyprenyl-3-methyl-5-hydroxy-6-metoxy-1,4-benzoquinol methylase
MRTVAMNRESYNAIAPSWDAARVSFHGRERHYVGALLDGLPEASHVLDLGCGTGRPIAEHILSRGHRVTGVDQAEALLQLARERFPNATWIHGPIETFASAVQFDAIVCWDTLFHIDRSEHESLLARFRRLLLPDGRLMLTFGGSEHPAFTDTMYGHTFFYDSHPPEKMLALLAGAGFEPIVSEFTSLPTAGRDKGRYVVVAAAAKPASAA